MNNKTIFALSTILGKSGVAVIRVSGEKALGVARSFGIKKELEHQTIRKVTITSPIDGAVIDQCMAAFFKGPNSFTGEDVLELQTHGSIAVVKRILNELAELEECRVADPGEFSRRAFMNSKMDLVMAEGLADLIDAETELQRQIAMRQMQGEQSNLYSSWREELLQILSKLEALIDFPTDDIPESELQRAEEKITGLANSMKHHLSQNDVAEVIHRGVRVAIVGAPNAGKSSLINALARRDVAIVSDIAGTTRDIIEVKLDLKGYPFIFFDTAGIRESGDVIEAEGIKRAKSALRDANFCIHVIDRVDNDESASIQKDVEYLSIPYVKLYNKSDMLATLPEAKSDSLTISLKSDNKDAHIDDLIKLLIQFAVDHYTPSLEPLLSCVRHKKLIEESIYYLSMFDSRQPLDIASEYVRRATQSISQIIGNIDVEDVLDIIFSNFCIGK
jgi:tRNA modification GTPase